MNTRHLFCKDCGYILDGVRDNCPECGRRFDPDHPATFSRRGPRERAIRKWLKWCFRCRTALFISFCIVLLMPLPMVRTVGEESVLIVLGLFFAVLLTLFVAAFKLKGTVYAMGMACVAMMLTPFFGFGLFVIPSQVQRDVADFFQSDHEEGND